MNPISNSTFIRPSPIPSKRVMNYYGNGSAHLINALGRSWWNLIISRGWQPQYMLGAKSSSDVIIDDDLYTALEDISTVYSVSVPVLCDVLGLKYSRVAAKAQRMSAMRQQENRAALAAALSNSPELFEALANQTKTLNGTLGLAESKFNELSAQRRKQP